MLYYTHSLVGGGGGGITVERGKIPPWFVIHLYIEHHYMYITLYMHNDIQTTLWSPKFIIIFVLLTMPPSWCDVWLTHQTWIHCREKWKDLNYNSIHSFYKTDMRITRVLLWEGLPIGWRKLITYLWKFTIQPFVCFNPFSNSKRFVLSCQCLIMLKIAYKKAARFSVSIINHSPSSQLDLREATRTNHHSNPWRTPCLR